MNAPSALKSLLILLLAVGIHQAALYAHPDPIQEAAKNSPAGAATSLAVPEPSSAFLIGTLGVMLMLRRRRLNA